MNKIFNIIFPTLCCVFILIAAAFYIKASRNGFRNKNQKDISEDKLLNLKDRLLICAITLVYAAVAFAGLGSTFAPQSFFYFEPGERIVIDLNEEVSIKNLMIYSGTKTGKLAFFVSEDGAVYFEAGYMEQKHSSVYKWNCPDEFLPHFEPVKKVIIASDSRLSIGEIAFIDEKGNVFSVPESLHEDASLSPLFDEQSLVPEVSSYENSTYFDEIYHARTANEFLTGDSVYETTHPPLGKAITALGIKLFGMTPFGWRFMPALSGVLMLPIIYILLKLLFSSTSVSACMTICFAFDFMHFVQTRISTIDCYGVLFTLLMYMFMAAYIKEKRESRLSHYVWLSLSGICFGVGASCKWTCIYAGGGLALIWLFDMIMSYFETVGKPDISDPASVKKYKLRRRVYFAHAERIVSICLVFFVIVPVLIYYFAYIPYCRCTLGEGGGNPFTLAYLKKVLASQSHMYNYHSSIVAEHPYSSRAYEWLLNLRPILYYLEYPSPVTKRSIAAFTSPLICWGGIAALIALIPEVAVHKDRRACFILLGFAANFAPWLLIKRLCFAYHYFPSVIFLILAIGYVFEKIEARQKIAADCAPGTGEGCRSEKGRGKNSLLIIFTILCVILFAAFYPVLSGIEVSRSYCDMFLSWLPRWPI